MATLELKPNKTLKGHKLAVLFGVTGPPKNLLGATFSDDEIKELETRFPDLELVIHKGSASTTDALRQIFSGEQWEDVTILVTGSALPEVEHASKLQYVQLQTAGTNHISSNPLFKDTDTVFCTASGVHGPQIAAWVITTFLQSSLKIDRYMDLHRQRQWQKLDHPEDDILSQRVGILGYGSVGRQVARATTALGMDVHACTLHPKRTPDSRRSSAYTPAGLGDPDGTIPSMWFSASDNEEFNTFLAGLDLLVIAIPLTEKTRGLISRREFDIMSRKRTFVSNVSRGAVVVAEDLAYALDHDVIRGAAIDVTDPEPLPRDDPLWDAKNLLITPHISGDSPAYARRVFEVLKHNLIRLSEGKSLLNQVNKSEGY